jgi:hypothetical protein
MRLLLLRLTSSALLVLAFALAPGCSDDSSSPQVEPAPTITTWAGTGLAEFDGDGHALRQSGLYWPIDVEFTPTRGAFIVDWNNHRIREVTDQGTLETVIGMTFFGDGPPAADVGADTLDWWPALNCQLNHPTRVQELHSGTYAGMLLLTAWHNHKLRLIDLDRGLERVLLGRGAGCQGDGSNDIDAIRLNQPSHGIQGPDGMIYVLDQRNQVVRRIDMATGACESIVGGDPVCSPSISGSYGGDGGDPRDARLSFPTGSNPTPGGGMAFDQQGRLYISDTMNSRIRRVDFSANRIVTVAGNGTAGFSGDGGPPVNASLNRPVDITFGPDGRLYVADSYNHRVRAIDFANDVIVTVAGNGQPGFSGDGGPAVNAQLYEPRGVAFDYEGNLIIADTYNHRFRKVQLQAQTQF